MTLLVIIVFLSTTNGGTFIFLCQQHQQLVLVLSSIVQIWLVLMIEVHNNPEKALCDGPQSLKPAKFEQLMKELKPIADAVGKEI